MTDVQDETEQVAPAEQRSASAGGAAPPCEAVRGKHVLIVGINYWPEPTGIAPYTTATAQHLARSAASVQVITGLPCYPTWTVDPAYRRGVRFVEQRAGVTVVRLRHYVPGRQDAIRRGAYEASFFAQAAAVRPAQKPDLVIGVTPALGGAAAAAWMGRRYRVPLVVVVQDLLGPAATQSGMAGGARVARAVGCVEGRVLRQARDVLVVAESFRPAVEAHGVDPRRVRLMRNWSHVAVGGRDRHLVRARLGWPADVKVALHAGNMGLKQDLGNVVEAARLAAGSSDLMWVLMGDGSQRGALQAQGKDLTNLRFLPLCSDRDFPDVLAAADILLLNERASMLGMSLPSKLTSYFRSGRPVAAAVHPGGTSAAELGLADAPTPAPPADPARLLALVQALAADPELRDSHALRARDYADTRLTPTAAFASLDAVLR